MGKMKTIDSAHRVLADLKKRIMYYATSPNIAAKKYVVIKNMSS